jgi:hypothetical protein
MDDQVKAIHATASEDDEPKRPTRPTRPRPGDEKAYEDSWYKVLKTRAATDHDS